MAKRKYQKRKYRKSKLKVTHLKKQTVYTVAAVWIWLFAIAITLSFFAEGLVLSLIRTEIVAYIGWTYFLLPPWLVTLSFLFFKLKSAIGKPNIPGGAGLFIISLIGITRAGIIGETSWGILSRLVSAEMTFVLYLGLMVISLIIFFDTSLDHLVNTLIEIIKNFTKGMQGLMKSFGEKAEKKDIFAEKHDPEMNSLAKDKRLVKAPVIPPPVTGKREIPKNKPEDTDLLKTDAIQTPSVDIGIWEYPPLTLLSGGPGEKADRGDVRKNAQIIIDTLDSFGIKAEIKEVNRGPAVTQYALKIALGTKVSKITSLSSDLALALAAPTGQVRIEAPIPGRDLVGIEIPNRGLEFVTLKRMLQSEQMSKAKSKLAVALGLDVSGSPLIADIGKMPHVLVAGTTGSGKSVLVNSWICSLLYRTTPQEVRLILVDPKRVELTGYNGVPHLLTPVIVDQDKILSALRWAMSEMEKRYKQFAEVGVRNIDGFNDLSGFQAMNYIVILIDELADLMAYAPVEVEDAICRLAQMARATGIHLVLATQRPSVDVITGLIKANIPSRIAFNVSSMVDSRVIIDSPGAEKLLGRGDMLFIPPDQAKPNRIQGTFVSEKEVSAVVEFLRKKNTPVDYTEEVLSQPVSAMKKGSGPSGSAGDGNDQLFDDALRLICQHDKASASLLQRRLSIGYARAARILDQLEDSGIIGPSEGSKPRDVLVKNPDDFYARQEAVSQTQEEV